MHPCKNLNWVSPECLENTLHMFGTGFGACVFIFLCVQVSFPDYAVSSFFCGWKNDCAHENLAVL